MDARNKLIEHNLRLVAHIIKKYYSNLNDQDDLVSIGTIGLIKAVDTFDASKGIRLSSNALTLMDIMSVEDSIIDELDIKIKSEKLYKYISEVLSPREKTIIELRYGLNNKTPLTQREVAKLLKISRSYVSRIEIFYIAYFFVNTRYR